MGKCRISKQFKTYFHTAAAINMSFFSSAYRRLTVPVMAIFVANYQKDAFSLSTP
jgi:hypothetical protein